MGLVVRIGDLSEEQFIAARENVQKTLAVYAKKYIFQLERGEEKKLLHYQCYVNLREKDRPGTLEKKLKAALKLDSISARPSSTYGREALKKYCMKKQTAVDGPWADHAIYRGQDLIRDLRPWQQQIVQLTDTTPHPRRIYWYYDPVGSAGKSSLAKYLYYHKKILTLTIGNAGDLLNMVSKMQGLPAYIFDISRTKGGKTAMSDLYQAIESVKNGYFINTKYETSVCCMAIPHIIVFSNFYPDKNALSQDRWVIRNLSQMSQE